MRTVYIKYKNKELGEDLSKDFWGCGKLINVEDTRAIIVKDNTVYINAETEEELYNLDMDIERLIVILEMEEEELKNIKETVYLWTGNHIIILNLVTLERDDILETYTVGYGLGEIHEMAYE